MTHVSKKQLKESHKKQLTKQLTSLFVSGNSKNTNSIFSDLCTESEQIMLVKRLAIILMIDKKYSTYRIAKTLLVSDSTVREIKKKYIAGAYSSITVMIKQKEFDKEQFWDTIGSLLRLGMPSMGKDRWKSIK